MENKTNEWTRDWENNENYVRSLLKDVVDDKKMNINKEKERIRNKSVAVIISNKGVLMVSEDGVNFSLPGGGCDKAESNQEAAIRELEEETGLKTLSIKYLYSYLGRKWLDHKRRMTRNSTKVFLIEYSGQAQPKNEIKEIAWFDGEKLT